LSDDSNFPDLPKFAAGAFYENCVRHVLMGLPVLFSAVDSNGKVLFASGHHTELAGVAADITALVEEKDLYPACVLKRFSQPLHQLVLAQGELHWAMSVQHKSGETHHYRVNQHCVNDDTNSRAVVSLAWQVLAPSTELENQNKKAAISYLSFHDPVTGLANRSLFYDRVQKSLSLAKRSHSTIALLLLDLDRFKNVNDSLGRDAGDLFLKHVAQKLAETLRDTDTVARLGGDEFVLVLDNISQAKDIELISEKLLSALAEPLCFEKREISVTASIGISLYPRDGDSIDQLLKHADMAMYQAKLAGKNRWQFFQKAMTDTAVNYLLLENDLRHAIENDELILHYQPQVNIESGRIVGLEALVRWQHKDRGMISPVEFIPLAEETGLIEPLGAWVLRKACVTFQKWLMSGLNLGKVAVNLSTRQFREEHFEQSVIAVLTETHLAPKYLELEITESSAMENAAETINTLRCLNHMGLSISIDDFGTGYSSLAYLKKFPIQKLKIDRSFINDIDTDDAGAVIAKSIIDLAHNMSLQVIAEGVERPAQSRWLLERGCDLVQGFYYSKPLSEEVLLELVNDKKRAIRDESGVRLIL
jgi:diguanylate cyclase (GGDEF)-like protein